MSDNETVLKAIKFSSRQLFDWVDAAILQEYYGSAKYDDDRYVGDTSKFVTQAAEYLAQEALQGSLNPEEHFLSKRHLPRANDSEEAVRTNVTIPIRSLPLIEEAARRLNHYVSPFLAWAALVQANTVLGSFPKLPKREPVVGEVNRRDGNKYTTMSIRYPLVTLKAMDKYRKKYEKEKGERITRSDVMEEAVYYTIQKRIVDEQIVDLLPESHSLNGGKKMVSFRLPTKLRNQADAAGAAMNHNTTGFLVFASTLFLNSFK